MSTETRLIQEHALHMLGPMILAALSGSKTQARVVILPQPIVDPNDGMDDGMKRALLERCPYGQPGDRLWVREQFAIKPGTVDCRWYAADFNDPDAAGKSMGLDWKAPNAMPREFARLVLEITEVRVGRLQDISDADTIAEGVIQEDLGPDPDNFHPPGSYGFVSGLRPFPEGTIYVKPQDAFAESWNTLNVESGDSWSSNPWVWTFTFRRISEAPAQSSSGNLQSLNAVSSETSARVN